MYRSGLNQGGFQVTTASAPGKTILFGEHAVVYGRPAIAVPVSDLRATAQVEVGSASGGVLLVAEDLHETYRLEETYDSDTARALQVTVRNTLEYLGLSSEGLALTVRVCSQIPIARGLGSGAAIATALVRALARHFGRYITASAISDLTYQTEIIFHGTPSGIDNTVVAFEKPVYFVKGERMDIFWVGRPFTLIVADTGVPSRTRDTVADVRQHWLVDRPRYEALFDAVGGVVDRARQAIIVGDVEALGLLMDENQALLQEMHVSGPELDRLIQVAREAGAKGAKLSGGGRGGCLIALANGENDSKIATALLLAGAAQVISTVVH